MKLSGNLRNKIKSAVVNGSRDTHSFSVHGMVFKTGGIVEMTAKVYFNYEEQELVKEVVKWAEHICKYFKTSYETYKVDIGRLEGVYPITIDSTVDGTQVEFSIDNIKPASWRDWFIQEGLN
jgi:hypothetical protein